MPQRITPLQELNNREKSDLVEMVQELQFKLLGLEWITDELLTWRDGTQYYIRAVNAYQTYIEKNR